MTALVDSLGTAVDVQDGQIAPIWSKPLVLTLDEEDRLIHKVRLETGPYCDACGVAMEPNPEDEWKTLATTEITHLTDEEKEHLPVAWDEWIARVRRDAAREALDGLVQKFQWGGWSDTLKRGSQPIDLMGNANRVTGWMRDYRDTHHPETEDQT